MKELWKRSFQLFRRHFVLWLPCSIAAILMLELDRLEKAEIHWLLRYFTAQHSVLGGEVPSSDLTQAQHRVMMVIYPLGTLKNFLEICFFVVALIATKNLVQMILDERRPGMISTLRGIVPQYREVLLFSLKYMAVMAAFVGIFIGLASSPLSPEHLQELSSSKLFVYGVGLVGEGCLAWLLVPSAIRLLQRPERRTILTQGRKIGATFAVTTSAGSLALQYLVGKAEATVLLDNQWESNSIAAVNTIIINAPQVLLFIALALLALQAWGEEGFLAAEPETNWGNRLLARLRRAREWKGDSF
jgi:hypothetical protein